MIPAKIRSIISERESDYFMEYNKVVTSYCNNIGLDLTSDLEVSIPSLYCLTPSTATAVTSFSVVVAPERVVHRSQSGP